MYTLEELMSHAAERYDPDVIVDLLDLSSNDLIQAFPEKFIDRQHNFELPEISMDCLLIRYWLGEFDEPSEET
jgi:hypothetical protein